MKVLIATDGSEFSAKAVEESCQLVLNQKHTDIKIISIVERLAPMATEPFAVSSEYYAEIEKESLKKAKNIVEQAEKTVKDRLKDKEVTVQTEVYTGNVKQVIVDEAKQFGADLIVVGSHGYGFIKRALLGSISDFVVHHAPCSVLVVRPE